MWRGTTFLGLLSSLLWVAALLAVAEGAHAIPVLVEARSVSQASAVGFPASSSSAWIRDGALVPGGNFAGASGSSSAGPLGAGATSAFANTTALAGPASATTRFTADLATATLRGFAAAGASGFSALALGHAKWTDTITFQNTSGGTVALGFSWTTNGVVMDVNGPAQGFHSVLSSIFVANVNNPLLPDITFLDTTPLTPAALSSGAQFNFLGVAPFFTFAPAGSNLDGIWTTSLIDPNSGILSATLLIPDGTSAVEISALLALDCRFGSTCDYGGTSSFEFGALPAGLSFTSLSGVFLTAVPGAVPEPGVASLFALAAGLALLGRRRKRA